MSTPLNNNQQLVQTGAVENISAFKQDMASHVINLAIIIIAALAAAEVMPATAAAGAITGLSIALMIGNCKNACADKSRNKNISAFRALTHIATMILGALVLSGALTAVTMGIAVAATAGAAYLIRCGAQCKSQPATKNDSILVDYFKIVMSRKPAAKLLEKVQ